MIYQECVHADNNIRFLIDDFALKKRQRYGTVMVDLETRKIVDMIESREMEDVKRWLMEYLNMYESGCNITAISQSAGFTYNTVKSYLSESFSPVNAHYGEQREEKLEPYS